MAFSPPTFNLLCDVYTFGTYPIGPPRLAGISCQWRGIGKMTAVQSLNQIAFFSVLTEILLPIGTDVRGDFETPINNPDTIVLSPGSLDLPFQTADVTDVGKGFTNEYRVAFVYKLAPWPVPIP